MKFLLTFFLLISLYSCTVYGLTSDYKKLSDQEQSMIITANDFQSLDDNHIYKVSGTQLKEELKKHPKSLVYVFTNGCTSQHCLPMSNYEWFAKENNYKLFLVMSGYTKLNQTIKQRSEVFTEPLFAIDNDAYNSNIRFKYTRYFENDLRGIPHKENPEWNGGLFFFEYDRLQKVTVELPN